MIRCQDMGTISQIRRRLPSSFESIVATPFDKVLNRTTALMVIKQIFNLIFTRQISIRLKLVRQVRLQRCSTDSRLQLRGMKNGMNMPPLRELQAERDSTNLLDNRKRPSPFGSHFPSQTRS